MHYIKDQKEAPELLEKDTFAKETLPSRRQFEKRKGQVGTGGKHVFNSAKIFSRRGPSPAGEREEKRHVRPEFRSRVA